MGHDRIIEAVVERLVTQLEAFDAQSAGPDLDGDIEPSPDSFVGRAGGDDGLELPEFVPELDSEARQFGSRPSGHAGRVTRSRRAVVKLGLDKLEAPEQYSVIADGRR